MWSKPLCYRLPRKLGEGNVFTGVCLSTWGWVSLVPGPFWGWLSLVPGPFRERWLCLGMDKSRGWVPPDMGPRGWVPTHPLHGIWSASRRYASYWNAFFLGNIIIFRRAVAQRCHGPHMKGLVSIGGAHQGNNFTTVQELCQFLEF